MTVLLDLHMKINIIILQSSELLANVLKPILNKLEVLEKKIGDMEKSTMVSVTDLHSKVDNILAKKRRHQMVFEAVPINFIVIIISFVLRTILDQLLHHQQHHLQFQVHKHSAPQHSLLQSYFPVIMEVRVSIICSNK